MIIYQDQHDNLPGCSGMQIKFTSRPQNVDKKHVPMLRTSLQEKNVALKVQKSITLHRNLSEQHNIEPHLGAHYNTIQRREQMEIQGIPANNEYSRAENIGVQGIVLPKFFRFSLMLLIVE